MYKYSMLRSFSRFATVVGWILIAGAGIMVFAGILQFGLERPQPIIGIVLLVLAVICVPIGTILAMMGEAVQVAIDTEANTAKVAHLLENMVGNDAGGLQRSRVVTPMTVPAS